MSDQTGETNLPCEDRSLDNERFWSLEKVLFFREYLLDLKRWPLAEACILLLDDTDFIFVQQLRRKYDAYELATGKYKRETIAHAFGLPSDPPKPDALNRGYSRAVEAIQKFGLPAVKEEDGRYLVSPSNFLQWAIDEGYFIPDGLLEESNAKFDWDGKGYSANQRLFIQRLVAQVILDPVEYLPEKGNHFKIQPLVDDIAKSGQWPAGMQPPKNKRLWYELARDVLAYYHEC